MSGPSPCSLRTQKANISWQLWGLRRSTATGTFFTSGLPFGRYDRLHFCLWIKIMVKLDVPRTSWEHLTTSVCGCSIVISNPERKMVTHENNPCGARGNNKKRHYMMCYVFMTELTCTVTSDGWHVGLCVNSPSVCRTMVSNSTNSWACWR